MFPIDMREALVAALRENNRPPDGLLHPSGHLRGSLRHAMLEVAGAPSIENDVISAIRLNTGTLWHEWTVRTLLNKGIPFMQEVRLTPWLPEGWAGTADWVFWSPEFRGFILGDMKTIKGEGMRWIASGGAKEEHIWQTSLYWHALYDSGLPMVQGIGVLYWPMNNTQDRGEVIQPEIVDFDPLPRDEIHAVAGERTALTRRYLESLSWQPVMGQRPAPPPQALELPANYFVTPELAPEQDRVQKVVWNKQQGVFDLKLVPHWSAEFCPYPDELCGCSKQGTTKVGHYTLDGNYVPRKDYEDVWAIEAPSEKDYRKRRKEAEVASSGT